MARLDLRDTSARERRQILADQIAGMTMGEVADWVEQNVNTMADAKQLLKRLAVIVAVLVRRERDR